MTGRKKQNDRAPRPEGRGGLLTDHRIEIYTLLFSAASVLISLASAVIALRAQHSLESERLAATCRAGVRAYSDSVQIVYFQRAPFLRIAVMCDLTNASQRLLSVTSMEMSQLGPDGKPVNPPSEVDVHRLDRTLVQFPLSIQPGETIRVFPIVGVFVEERQLASFTRVFPKDTSTLLRAAYFSLQHNDSSMPELPQMLLRTLNGMGAYSDPLHGPPVSDLYRVTLRTGSGLSQDAVVRVSTLWELY